jgi:hypothetical protein
LKEQPITGHNEKGSITGTQIRFTQSRPLPNGRRMHPNCLKQGWPVENLKQMIADQATECAPSPWWQRP